MSEDHQNYENYPSVTDGRICFSQMDDDERYSPKKHSRVDKINDDNLSSEIEQRII